MKSQFTHDVFSSFMLWFEYQLISDKGLAYTKNQSNSFEFIGDFKDIPSSHYAYQGRFRGLVQDHSIDQPNSGIFINDSFVTGSSQDVIIDYENGRVVVPTASGSALNITANNSVKEIQVYPNEDDEVQLLITSDFVDFFDPTSTYLSSKEEQINEKTYLLPACFLRNMGGDSNAVSFGGEDDTKTKIRALVLAKDNYLIDGVMSLFSDLNRSCVKHIPYEAHPYGVLNSIKSFPYSYSEYSADYGEYSYIENVKTSKLDYGISMNKLEKNLLIGFIDFDLSTFRFP